MRTAQGAIKYVVILSCISVVLMLCDRLLYSSDLPTDPTYLKHLLDESEKHARNVSDSADRFWLLSNISLYRARLGQVEEAERLIKELEPEYKKHFSDPEIVFSEIAHQFARAGDVEAAIEASQKSGASSTTVKVVVITHESKSESDSDPDEKVDKTDSGSSWRNDEALYVVAEELVKRGMLKEADRIMGKLARQDNLRRRGQIIIRLAAIASARGWKEYATGLFNQAESLSSEFTSEIGMQGAAAELALGIAAQQRLCGNVGKSDVMFSATKAQIEALEDKERKEQYLASLVEASALAGNFMLAKQTQEGLTDEWRRTQAMVSIAGALLAKGQISEASPVVYAIPGVDWRVSMLLSLAEAQAEADIKLARKTLKDATDLIELSSVDSKAWHVANLARIEYKLGDKKEASDLWEKSIKLSDLFTIHPEREQYNLKEQIARMQAEVGDMKKALKTAKLLGDSVFSDICAESAAIGQTESALKWIEKQKNPKIKAESLIGVIRGLMRENSNQLRYGSIELSECK